MMMALKEAKKAMEDGEVPVGAIVVLNEKVIAHGQNMVEKLNDPTAHAEMIALTSAFTLAGCDSTAYPRPSRTVRRLTPLYSNANVAR